MDKELDEALKWADQPLDRVIDRDVDALWAIHVLAKEVRSSLSTIRAQEEEMAGLAAKLAYVEHGLKCRQEDERQAHRSFHESMDKIPLEVKNLHDSKASIADMMEKMVTRAEQAESSLAAERANVAKAVSDTAVAYDKLNAAEAKVAELRTPLADWDKKLAEKNDALSKRNARIVSLEKDMGRAREAYSERVAQLTAHRVCCGNEHDAISKFHGYCVVCGVPWPCEYAGKPPAPEAKP